MEIYIENKRKKPKNILKLYPNALIIDVTSNAKDEYQQLSPFYPIGNIPVPGMPKEEALCVEGIWQGLKVFESFDWDKYYFTISTKNIKRTVRKFGRIKGHYYKGELLSYVDARKQIYLPAYKTVLENKRKYLVDKLRSLAEKQILVLLDYTTNASILDPRKPLSHAAVIKAAILENYKILEQNVEQVETAKTIKGNKKKEFIQGDLFE